MESMLGSEREMRKKRAMPPRREQQTETEPSATEKPLRAGQGRLALGASCSCVVAYACAAGEWEPAFQVVR